MRLSELMHRPVVGAGGKAFGKTVDVRLVREGPADAAGQPRVRIDGLVVGRRATVARLGLLRPGGRGPAILLWLARVLGGHRTYVPWSAVRSFRGGSIVIDGEPGDLPEAGA